MPDGKKILRKKYRKKHKCHNKKFKTHEHKDRPYWWLPGCQVAPTAPLGQKELCEGHVGHYVPRTTRHGNIDTYGRVAHDPKSNAAPSLTSRRWSSVEIGAHPFLLQPRLRLTPVASKANTPYDFAPSMLNQRYRSSTFTRGAIDHDIVRTVRERLTLRKVAKAQLETPASITLRRASGEYFITNSGGNMESYSSQGQSSPAVRSYDKLNERLSSGTYLITSKDIETITQLIEANLKRKYEAQSTANRQVQSLTGSPMRSTRQPSITSKGLLPANSVPVESAITFRDVEPIHERLHNPAEYLQVATAKQTKKNHGNSRTGTDKSINEVIWEGGGSSAQSLSDVTDEGDHSHTSTYNYSSEQNKPNNSMNNNPFDILKANSSAANDKGDAFDPKNARASINEWSFRCPQNELAAPAVVVTSSDSDSGEKETPTQHIDNSNKVLPPVPGPKERRSPKLRPYLRYTASETKLQDVVSFPSLLSRKTTSDWYSPLPELETSKTPLATSRSLHDMGLDITVRPASEDSITPKASTNFHPSVQGSPQSLARHEIRTHRSVEFTPRPLSQHKSAVLAFSKTHPTAPPRLGNKKSIGSSLGASSHRRKSSTPGLKRVRTVDNPHKGNHDPCTKWRKPSVCPPQVPPSPSEYEDAREDWIEDGAAEVEGETNFVLDGMALENLRRLSIRLGIFEKKCPPLPKADCIGIYGTMSGGAMTGILEGGTGVNGNGRGRSGTCVGHGSGEVSCGTHNCDDCDVDPRSPSVDWIG